MKLKKEFYLRSAEELAPKLLGKLLCVNMGSEIIKKRITETECYLGEQDTACHAHKGRTKRTEILYSQGSVAYVYLCYGIHSLLNVVTGEKDFPQAVLIRAVEGINGPGRLTKALGINTDFNGEDLVSSNRLWLEDDGVTLKYNASPRVGIDYASKEDRERLWRYTAK